MNLRNQQQEMQKCSARGSEFKRSKSRVYRKEYQEQLQPFATSAVKVQLQFNKSCQVAGGTNKLNEEVKQELKGEINQKQVMQKLKLPNTAKLDSLTGVLRN